MQRHVWPSRVEDTTQRTTLELLLEPDVYFAMSSAA